MPEIAVAAQSTYLKPFRHCFGPKYTKEGGRRGKKEGSEDRRKNGQARACSKRHHKFVAYTIRYVMDDVCVC